VAEEMTVELIFLEVWFPLFNNFNNLQLKINTYSPQIMKYLHIKPGIILIFIYQLSI